MNTRREDGVKRGRSLKERSGLDLRDAGKLEILDATVRLQSENVLFRGNTPVVINKYIGYIYI